MGNTIDTIRTRGYWQLTIRPVNFIDARVEDILSLYPIIEKAAVSLRGWDFPHLESRQERHVDVDWVGQDHEWEHHLSSWRFYRSGLFVFLGGIPIDWRDHSNWWPPEEGWEPGQLLGVGDALFQYTEFFEFAARLSLSDAGDQDMFIETVLHGLKGRTLYMDSRNKWGFSRNYTSSIDSFPFRRELARTELIGNTRELAVRAAQELFKRFQWATDFSDLKSFQTEIVTRY